MGPFTQVLVARDGVNVVGVACRAVRQMYINGVAEDIGYLGQLRVDPLYRGRLLVARGFRMLRELHEDGKVRGYVTTIIEGNDEAVGVLVRCSRGGMPKYRFIERLFSLAVPVRRVAPASGRPPSLSRPEAGATREIAAFLAKYGPRRNFFPVYAGEPLEFVTVERGGELAGVAALWDQRGYKQTIIDGYDPLLKMARPLYNIAARVIHKPILPKPGTALRTAYASFFCLAEDDPDVAHELIERLRVLAGGRGLDHVLLGFTAGDPLLAAARDFHPIEYPSCIYTVAWNDKDDLHDRLDSRPRALELAAL
jgi:hypothetical protein